MSLASAYFEPLLEHPSVDRSQDSRSGLFSKGLFPIGFRRARNCLAVPQTTSRYDWIRITSFPGVLSFLLTSGGQRVENAVHLVQGTFLEHGTCLSWWPSWSSLVGRFFQRWWTSGVGPMHTRSPENLPGSEISSTVFLWNWITIQVFPPFPRTHCAILCVSYLCVILSLQCIADHCRLVSARHSRPSNFFPPLDLVECCSSLRQSHLACGHVTWH